MGRVAVVSLFKFTLSALPLPRQSPGSCCSVSHSIADEGAKCIMIHGKARWEGESSCRPFCSRVMKERQVVMKERAIPGPCNCCPRGPRIQYYSMGLAIWIEKDKRYPVTDRLIETFPPRGPLCQSMWGSLRLAPITYTGVRE